MSIRPPLFDIRTAISGKPIEDVLTDARIGHTLYQLSTARRKPTGKSKQVRAFLTPQAAVADYEQRHGKRSGLWWYRNAQGEVVAAAVRWDTPATKGKPESKTYRPISKHPDGWRQTDPPDPRKWPLYNLPELLSRPNEAVYICEGEKAADAARSVGLLATTSAHGSKSAAKTDWTHLVGHDAVLVPDHDAAGEHYIEDVAGIVTKLNPPAKVRKVRLADLDIGRDSPKGGDVADLLHPDADDEDHRGLREAIETAADEAQVYVPEPTEPAAALLRYESFPVDAMPEPARQYILALANAMVTDTATAAIGVLTAASAAIGTTRAIRLTRRWVEMAVLWMAIVAEQGSGKSPPVREAMRPLNERQQREMDRYAEARQLYERELTEYERDLAAWRKSANSEQSAKPEPRACVRHIVQDTTIEGLFPILAENPRGVLSDGDELAGWFSAMNQYKGGKGADAALWRLIWDGKPATKDRRKDREMIYVHRPFVSIVGTIQPSILRLSLGTEHRESGLAARWLFAMPPQRPQRWPERDIPVEVERRYEALIERLLDLDHAIDERGKPQPVVLPMDEAAKQIFIAWRNEHGKEQANLSGVLAGNAAKLVAYVARLALVVQLDRRFQCPSHRRAGHACRDHAGQVVWKRGEAHLRDAG